jgi:putative ABC transport system permease protein
MIRRLAGLFVALVARHVVLHRGRTLLTVASVAVGVAVVVAVAIANGNAVASFEGSASYLSGGATIEALTNGPGFPDAAVASAAAVPGVAVASGVVAGSVTEPASHAAYDLLGIDVLAAVGLAERSGAAVDLSQARFSPRIFERGAIVMSASLARRLNATLGDRVALVAGVRQQTFLVAGIVDDAAMPLGARGTIFCDLSTAQEALGRIGRVDRIDVVPAAGASSDRVAALLSAVLPRGARVVAPAARSEAISKMTEAFRFNLAALAAIALLVGAFLVFNAVSMSVVQRRAEIGIARAVGATRRAIFATFLLEGLAVGAVGSAFGLLLGLALARATLNVVAGTIDQLYAGTTVLGWTAPPQVYVLAFAIGIGTALAASLIPALEAASVAPSVAVRVGSWERPASASTIGFASAACLAFAFAVVFARLPSVGGKALFGYASALAVLAGCALLAPAVVAATARVAKICLPSAAGAPLRLAPANLRARVRRNGVAVASLMIGVAMTMSVSTMIASFRESVQTWIGQTLRGDLFARPSAAVDADDVVMPGRLAVTASRVAGVAAVDVVRSKQIDVGGRPAFIGASDMRVTSVRGFLPLIDGGAWHDVATGLIGTSNALVSEPFARKFHVGRGSQVVIEGQNGPARLDVGGVYEDYSSDTGFVFVDINTYHRLFGDDGINGFAVYGTPGISAEVLRGRVQAAMGTAQIAVQTNGELRAEALAQFDRTFAVTSVLDVIAVAVALMGVVATLAALVLERKREIGVLRCLGMTRGQVRTMIFAEASLLGVMGASLGTVAGYALAAILVFVINPQAFGWTIGFRATPAYDAALFAGVVLTAALAGLVPAANAARLDVGDAVRAE